MENDGRESLKRIMEKPGIFISYSSKDRDTAALIQQQLESAGYDIWRDKTRLETDWSREIAQALADSDVLCLLWSEQAAHSKWVKHEWLTARALEKTIILCRLPKAPKPPEPLHNLQDVNIENLEKSGQELVGRLNCKNDFTVKYDYTTLPKNSYIPFNPNPNFTGRGQDLLDLYLKLIGNLNKIGINQVGTIGMGGIGKTQLAIEFAYRFSFAFDGVYWIQAANEGKWLRQFVELARDRLQLSIASDPDKPEADRQYIYALQKYCKENPGMLILMDNVAEPKCLNSESFLFGLTPLTLGCDLLFTTRKHFRLPGVSSQPVNILSNEGAYNLLTSYRNPSTSAEKKHATSICNAIGYLPLAIILAGAFLKRYESETPFEDYHGELLKNKLDTVDIGDISEEVLSTRHDAAITTTLKSQWEVLDDEDAKTLFQLAGQFPEAEIIPKARLGLLSGIGPGKSKLDQPSAKAFNLLQELNFVEKLEGDASAIRLHPLVHAFSRRLLSEKQGATLKAAAAKKLKTAIFNYTRLQSELEKRGIKQLLGDMEVAIDWWGDGEHRLRDLELLHGALRLSFNPLSKDSGQLVTQLLGRLMSSKAPGISNLLEQAVNRKKGRWLRILTPSLTPPCGPLLGTLEGHSEVVNAVAIALDGKMAVSASRDLTLRVWNLHTGEVLQTLEGHSKEVNAVAITPDGTKVVSGSSDRTLKVWDLHTGKVPRTLAGHSKWVNALVVAPDGKTVVSVSGDTTLKVWDIHTGEVLQTLEGISDIILDVAIAPDRNIAVLALLGETLKVWDLNTGEVLQTLEGHSGTVYAVAIAPDGKTVVSGSYDRTLRVWDLKSGEVLRTLEGHSKEVTAVAITPDGKTVVSGSYDRTLRVWDLKSGEVLQTLTGHGLGVTAVAIAPDGKTAVSGSWDETLKIWDLHAGEVLQIQARHGGWVYQVAMAPDGKTAVSGSSDETLKVWDLHTGKVLQTLEGHSGKVFAVAIAPDGMTVVSASGEMTLKVWDLHTGEVLQTLKGHQDIVQGVVILPDGKTAVSGSWDETLKVWDLHTGEVLRTLAGHGGRVYRVAIAPDGMTVVSASGDETLKVWDLNTGEVLQTLEGHSGTVYAVAIAPDGKTVVSGSYDRTLRVWDLKSGEVLRTLAGHSNCVWNVAITSDGKKAVSASRDKTLKVWDLESGIEIANFCGDSGICGCCISLDGKTIVAGESSGRVHFLWIEGIN